MRNRLPPWPVILSLVMIVAARTLNSRLAFGSPFAWPVAGMHGLMMGMLLVFWLWPPLQQKPSSIAGRLAGLLVLVYVSLLPICDRVERSGGDAWIAYLYAPLFNFLLAYPLARLFTRLRLDGGVKSTLALAHAAVFFFWALMVPAVIQGLRSDAPGYLRWLQLLVPVLTAAALATHLTDRAALTRPWHRELARLLLDNWRLPLLFLLGELGVIFVGVFSGD